MTVYVLVFLAVFAYVSWRNFRVGLYLILMFLPTYLLRFSVGGVPTTLLELMIYAAFIVWLVRWGLKAAPINLAPLRSYVIPLLLLAGGLAVGAWVAPDRLAALGIVKGWFVDPVLLAVMLATTLSAKFHIQKTIVALSLSGLFLSAVTIWRVVSGHVLTIDGRASAFLDSANYLALYLVPIILLGVGLLATVKAGWRWWVGVVLAVMLVALCLTLSYAGWLALLAGLIVWGLVNLRTIWPIIIGIGVGLGAIISQWQHPKFQQMLDFTGRSSTHVRLQTWQTTLLMIRENWVTGIGLGAYESRYASFANRLFSVPLESSVLHPHNVFLHFWVSTGVLGLAGFGWLIVNFAREAIRALHHSRPLAGAVLSAMVALVVHGLFDGAYFKNDLAALFWALLAFAVVLNYSSPRAA